MNKPPKVDERYLRWYCQVCWAAKPVPQLARDCEARHEREAE